MLRRVLPEVAPRTFANLLSVPHLPPKEFSILPPSVTSSVTSSMTFDPDQAGILDVFLACIAKSLSIQTKVKSYGSGKSMSSFVLSDCLTAKYANLLHLCINMENILKEKCHLESSVAVSNFCFSFAETLHLSAGGFEAA